MELPVNQIVCGDCLEVMASLPDKCVDLVLTDPPYGIGEARGRNASRSKLAVAKDYGFATWDDEPMSGEQIQQVRRVGKEQIIFGGNYIADKLPASPCWLVWDKDNGKSDFADCELAWTSFKKAVRLIKWRWAGMLQEPRHPKDKREHPTQKPLGVMRWIIEKYSKPNDLILDPFCGSGTTCVAAEQLGRKWIGIEISEEYCKIARKRIQEVRSQHPLLEGS